MGSTDESVWLFKINPKVLGKAKAENMIKKTCGFRTPPSGINMMCMKIFDYLMNPKEEYNQFFSRTGQ